jgi:hypothetical protein
MLGRPGYQVIRILRIPGYQGASRDITQLPVGCIEPTLYGVSVGYFHLAEDHHVQIMFATGTQFWSKKKHNIKDMIHRLNLERLNLERPNLERLNPEWTEPRMD